MLVSWLVLRSFPWGEDCGSSCGPGQRRPRVAGFGHAGHSNKWTAAMPDTAYPVSRGSIQSITISAQGAGRNVGIFRNTFPSRTGASSICGLRENCWPCTYRQPRWKLSSAWEVPIFPATTAIRKAICVALWHGLLFLLPALCVRLMPLLPSGTRRHWQRGLEPPRRTIAVPIFSCFVRCPSATRNNFALGSRRSDDRQLGRPIASPPFFLFPRVHSSHWSARISRSHA
jgi:hypothetical protein